MSKILIDTTRLNNNIIEMDKLITKYNNLINTFFDTLDMGINNSWKGKFAENYKNAIKSDKLVFLDYSKYLKKCLNELTKISNNFQTEIIKREE